MTTTILAMTTPPQTGGLGKRVLTKQTSSLQNGGVCVCVCTMKVFVMALPVVVYLCFIYVLCDVYVSVLLRMCCLYCLLFGLYFLCYVMLLAYVVVCVYIYIYIVLFYFICYICCVVADSRVCARTASLVFCAAVRLVLFLFLLSMPQASQEAHWRRVRAGS